MRNIFGLVIFVLYILAIVDIVRSSMDSGKKVIWILIVIFLPVIGTLLYYVVGRK